jgi:hypothetical protein
MIRRAKYTPELKRFHRLMEPNYSLDSYWTEINRRDDAARSTAEAQLTDKRGDNPAQGSAATRASGLNRLNKNRKNRIGTDRPNRCDTS